MLKLVKNEFFIYCKESRIESKRSFYGSFSLGPFDAGQSLTIANALRRTLLSELKGLAITSAEIEGAFHEYSTLPGVRDSILDILLNLKDIVLKTENYGNKKRGSSYAATFKKTQIGYLKTRGPGIITASELKLPPGIQCVDPEQYIATLSEEGILNIKIVINEGKNYVVRSTSLTNLTQKPTQKEAEKNNSVKELIPQNLIPKTIKKTKLNKKQSTLPLSASPYSEFPPSILKGKKLPLLSTKAKEEGIRPSSSSSGTEKVALRSFRNFEASTILKKRRNWLRKTTLLNIRNPFLFFNQTISNTVPFFLRKEGKERDRKNKRALSPREAALPFSPLLSFGKEKSSSFSILLMKKSALFAKKKREGLKEGSNLPPWIKILFKNNQNENLDLKSSLTSFSSSPFEEPKGKGISSFPLSPLGSKNSSLSRRESLPFENQGFSKGREREKKGEGGSSNGKELPVPSGGLAHLREGKALRASKAIALSIDAVFMPVNRVNYIIETNEQSVMLKNTSNTNFASFASLNRSPSVLVTSKEQANSESLLLPAPEEKDKESGLNFKNLPTKKKTFLKSTAAQNLLLAVSKNESVALPRDEKLGPLSSHRSATKKDLHKNNHFFDLVYSRLLSQRDRKEEDKKRTRGGDYMRLSENETKRPLKNNIIIEVWTNGSIHPRQALYEACKNLLSLFSKLEKATPLAFPPHLTL